MKKLKFWLWALFGLFKKNPPIKIGQIPPIDLGEIRFVFPGIAQGSGTAIVKHDPLQIVMTVKIGISEKTKAETMMALWAGTELIIKEGSSRSPKQSQIRFHLVRLYAAEKLIDGSDRFFLSAVGRKGEGEETEWDYFTVEDGE
jgi:hypothetical protein